MPAALSCALLLSPSICAAASSVAQHPLPKRCLLTQSISAVTLPSTWCAVGQRCTCSCCCARGSLAPALCYALPATVTMLYVTKAPSSQLLVLCCTYEPLSSLLLLLLLRMCAHLLAVLLHILLSTLEDLPAAATAGRNRTHKTSGELQGLSASTAVDCCCCRPLPAATAGLTSDVAGPCRCS